MVFLHTLRFGSPADIAVILVVVIIIFGPKKLPEVGKQFGQSMREMRKITCTGYKLDSLADLAIIFVLMMALIVIVLLSNGSLG